MIGSRFVNYVTYLFSSREGERYSASTTQHRSGELPNDVVHPDVDASSPSANARRQADAAIVDRIRQGDVETFQALFQREWDSLCVAAVMYTHDMDVAEELVATIFADLWIRRETLSITATLRTYLHTAVKHRTVNWRRDKTRRERLVNGVLASEIPGMAQAQPQVNVSLERSDIVARATKVVNSLPERYRLAFLYRWRDEWEYADIAAVLGVSVNGAQALVSRALKMIREKLTE